MEYIFIKNRKYFFRIKLVDVEKLTLEFRMLKRHSERKKSTINLNKWYIKWFYRFLEKEKFGILGNLGIYRKPFRSWKALARILDVKEYKYIVDLIAGEILGINLDRVYNREDRRFLKKKMKSILKKSQKKKP